MNRCVQNVCKIQLANKRALPNKVKLGGVGS